SFGISGTNAHVVIEQGEEIGQTGQSGATDPTIGDVAGSAADLGQPMPWLVSAKDDQALRAQAARLAAWTTEATRDATFGEVGAALARGRAVLERRAVVLGADRD
ncbi:hypothetical protein, partial [Sphaerisporangium melleum]